MLKKVNIIALFLFISVISSGQQLHPLGLSDDNRYLTTSDGQPFFWLGGTAWELLHRLNRQEIDIYLKDRAEKGFTVIQTVILAELDGLNTPNALGDVPLENNEPARLNEPYFELVDYMIKRAGELGLYVGLLPTWGDKFNKGWGTGPEIFNAENAEIYGRQLAQRYHLSNNLIWILGGDRIPESEQHYTVIRAMAKGIREIDSVHLITYHPSGGRKARDLFVNDEWLDLDMFQSGHSSTAREYRYVIDSKNLKPEKPVINGEARYENIPDRFWEDQYYGWLDDADVRISAYWSIISGAAGYTYGCNDIWQMYDIDKDPVIQARTDWNVALDLPGATHMGFMRKIFERLPWQEMQYDPSLILNENPEGTSFVVGAIGNNRDFIVAYTPQGQNIKIDASQLDLEKADAFWYNPRSGKIKHAGVFSCSEALEFRPWSTGHGSDFLLILIDPDLSSDITGLN